MSKPFCGPHMLMESVVAGIQIIFVINELLVLYTLQTQLWIVNPFIDTGVFIAGHLFNFFYYKIKCREHTLTKQTILEISNLLISLILIFLLIQLSPNVSFAIYNNQTDTPVVLGLIVVQFILMTAVLNQFAGIIRGMISMSSRCYINYTRKKNRSLQQTSSIPQNAVVSSLLDDLNNEIESNQSSLLKQSVFDP